MFIFYCLFSISSFKTILRGALKMLEKQKNHGHANGIVIWDEPIKNVQP